MLYFIKFCGVLCFRSEWWNLTKCSLFCVTMKSFTSRATVRKMWLFFHDVLWCPSDLQTLVHNKTLSTNFLGTFLCKVKKFAVHTILFATKVWASDKHHNTRNCQETLLVSNLTWQDLFFAYMYLKFNRYSNIRENFFGRKKWQHLKLHCAMTIKVRPLLSEV